VRALSRYFFRFAVVVSALAVAVGGTGCSSVKDIDAMNVLHADNPVVNTGADVHWFEGTFLRFDNECFYLENGDKELYLPIFMPEANGIQNGNIHGVKMPDGTEMWEGQEYEGIWFELDGDGSLLSDEGKRMSEKCSQEIGDIKGHLLIESSYPWGHAGDGQS